MAGAEFHRASIDGSSVLRLPGRYRRRPLPLLARPADSGPAGSCFLCHPQEDELYRGPWPDPGSSLHVLGNAHPASDTALLVAPAGPTWHEHSPGRLPVEHWDAWARAALGEEFRRDFGFRDRTVAAFLNTGSYAGQSRRHPHLQVIGLAGVPGLRPGAVREECFTAEREGRRLPVPGTDGFAVLPRSPALTAELWLPLTGSQQSGPSLANLLAVAARACEERLSGSYNVVFHGSLGLVRLVPRGISERAGLELSLPGLVDSVVAASLEESLELWSQAFELC